MIFEKYFDLQGEPNAAGEYAVCCPFPHVDQQTGDEYLEKIPSAHVNIVKGTFHCKVCRSLGRFNNGGMSEIAFYAKANGLSYTDAAKVISMMKHESNVYTWDTNKDNLKQSAEAMRVVMEVLQLDGATVDDLQLGYMGDGIQFPVFVHGELLDIRTYDPDGKPKVRSQAGAKPFIFPFDLWVNDPRPTLLCEGEKDTAIARKNGFNAITITGGAGAFPTLLKGYFKGRKVFIAYDCDDAGRTGARIVGYHLHDVAEEVRVIDLGLGNKEDIHDFFTKYKRTSEDLYQLFENSPLYTQEDAQEDRKKVYHDIPLWEAPSGSHLKQEVTSRVMVTGKYDSPLATPVVVNYQCTGYDEEESACKRCPFRRMHPSGEHTWTLSEENSHQLLKLVDNNLKDTQVEANLRSFVGIPKDCPSYRKEEIARKAVRKVTLSPDVDSLVQDDPMANFKSEELIAYVIEPDNDISIEDGGRYRIYYKAHPHPLEGQKIRLVVHRVERSDNPVDAFYMTPIIKENLQVFQGDPKEKMAELAERAKSIIGSHADPMLVWATDLIYHSPLQFYFGGALLQKGYPEGIIVGESRTGKTDVAQKLQQFYGLGAYTDSKNASIAGMIGGADKLNGGGYRLRWGKIPRNNKGLLIVDEFSGMPVEVFNKMTSVRSSQVARIEKIANGSAPAYTRLLWISNPRVGSDKQSTPILMYPTGIDVLLELIGSDEDIARFDFAILKVSPENLSSPLDHSNLEAYDQELYQQLIYWAWSRKPEDIVFEEGIEELIVMRGRFLNERYPSNVKIFGAEAWKKIARLAVAVACRLFSSDDTGERVVIKKEHVDFASRFMVDCYDNDIFRIKQYIEARRPYTEVDENATKVVETLSRQYPSIIRALINSTGLTLNQLQALAGLGKDDFNNVIGRMNQYYLIQHTQYGIQPSFRLRKTVAILDKTKKQRNMIPLGAS